MTAFSIVPPDVSAADRLREYLWLVREMSLQQQPEDLLRTYRSRAQFVVPYDHAVSFSGKDQPPGRAKITRTTRWSRDVNPWKEPDRIPTVESPFVARLMHAAHPAKMDALCIDDNDPIAPYLAGMRTMAVAPIFHQGHPTYMVMLLRAVQPFSLDDLATLTLTANLVGTATSQLLLMRELEQAYAALDREFRVVGEIQRDLLPATLPEIPAMSIAAFYETSTRAGGDYYDFFERSDGTWGIIIADVSGHGTPAAVVMAMMHAILHAPWTCEPTDGTPMRVLSMLNKRLIRSMRPGNFVTAFFGVLDPRERSLRYVLAGHDPPRVLRADGRVEGMAPTDGLPLAIEENVPFTEQTIRFAAGDRLLLYTDGITETFSPNGELFGHKRLDEAFRRTARTPQDIIDSILRDVRKWGNDAPPRDDRTLVAMAFD